jgi:ABC-type dipeptide/oligopeptide/nickel transport system permease component
MHGPLAYTIRRIVFTIPTLFAMSLFVFAIVHLAPGIQRRQRSD